MNQLHLRAFHHVATAGSFTKAAAALHITQPTLSEQVKALETRYGISLFSRRGRSIALTPLGAELLEITHRMEQLEIEAEACLTDARELRHARLRIGSDAAVHVMPILAALTQHHPGIDLSLVSGNASAVLGHLLNHRVDAAVLSDVTPDRRLATMPLREDHLIAFAHVDHPLAGAGRVTLRELAQQRLVIREPGSTTRRITEAALSAAGVTVAELLEVDGREAVQVAVTMNLGVGIVAESELSRDPRIVALTLDAPALVTTEWLACLAERRDSRLLRAVFDAAREAHNSDTVRA